MSGIEAVTLELRHAPAVPARRGYYVVYDAWRRPHVAWWTSEEHGWRTGDGSRIAARGWLGPIPENDPRTGDLQWPRQPEGD